MSAQPILLQILLRQRQWHRYGLFLAAYDDAAREIDRGLVGTAPSRAQLHRWLSGELKRLPYTDHCRVLEQMFPGWRSDQLFGPCPDDVLNGRTCDGERADVVAVFPTRADFTRAMPPDSLFDQARDVRIAGLSLNLVCQQYPDQRLHHLLDGGTELRCLFLDPRGDAIQAREREEGYTDHHLIRLTELNIEVLSRLRDRLHESARERLKIAVYDETLRFGIVLVDGRTCVMQPYLPHARGLDSPTFVVRRRPDQPGLYSTFERIYTELWERSRPV